MTDDGAREDLRQLQAETEGIDPGRTVTWKGRVFAVREQVPAMALAKFAAVAEAGMTTSDMRALSALYHFLAKTLTPDSWRELEQAALDTDADTSDLLDAVQQVYAVLTGRPTGQPPGSSPGRPATSANSTDARSSAQEPVLNGSTPVSSPT